MSAGPLFALSLLLAWHLFVHCLDAEFRYASAMHPSTHVHICTHAHAHMHHTPPHTHTCTPRPPVRHVHCPDDWGGQDAPCGPSSCTLPSPSLFTGRAFPPSLKPVSCCPAVPLLSTSGFTAYPKHLSKHFSQSNSSLSYSS